MKVALLQIRLDPTSHAGNTQRLTRVIDEAAGVAPAPDLLVLPGGCDTGGVVTARHGHESRLGGVRETLAWKAREWGLFVAAGLHSRCRNRWVLGAELFDPDGDLVAKSAPFGDGKQEGWCEGVASWPSGIGTLGVLAPALVDAAADFVASSACGVVMALPLVTSVPPRRRETAPVDLEALRKKLCVGEDAFWALVCPAGQSDVSDERTVGVSCLCGPGGTVLAQADGWGESVVYVDVPIELAREHS